jgi:glucose/arabinose dehydrogenase
MAGCSTERGAAADEAGATTGAATKATPEDPSPRFTIETVASGLVTPWALAFAPDGRIFVTERLGRIRIVRHGALVEEPWATVAVKEDGEAGLMGIALSPDFARTRHVFVVGAFRGEDDELVNRVIRYTERDGKGVEPTVIVDSIPGEKYHAGDAIAFGPDGMLYVATGDAREPGDAQDHESLAGKILRYEPDGRVPHDNPVRGSPVYASGLRNPQGIAWEPWTKQLFAIDHGPSGFPNERLRRNHDELNAIRAGGNYGWPTVAGEDDDSRYVAPMLDWTPGIAPAGLAVYTGEDFPEWRGHLFVGALRGMQLRRVAVARGSDGTSGWRVVDEQVIAHGLGRIRAVGMGPDGFLYFATSNRDGRGAPGEGDDRLMRLAPTP